MFAATFGLSTLDTCLEKFIADKMFIVFECLYWKIFVSYSSFIQFTIQSM